MNNWGTFKTMETVEEKKRTNMEGESAIKFCTLFSGA